MKKKFLLLNFSLVIAVLFSMLFQSLDSYSHFEKQKTELKCHHKSTSKHEITHQHPRSQRHERSTRVAGRHHHGLSGARAQAESDPRHAG